MQSVSKKSAALYSKKQHQNSLKELKKSFGWYDYDLYICTPKEKRETKKVLYSKIDAASRPEDSKSYHLQNVWVFDLFQKPISFKFFESLEATATFIFMIDT